MRSGCALLRRVLLCGIYVWTAESTSGTRVNVNATTGECLLLLSLLNCFALLFQCTGIVSVVSRTVATRFNTASSRQNKTI